MHKILFLAQMSAFICSPLLPAQTPPPESQTLQSILEEVRMLRQELQSTAATVQRMQILLYRIRNQMELVARVRQEHDEAQMALTQSQYQRDQTIYRIKQQQEMLDATQDAGTRHTVEENLERMKNWLEQLDRSEPDAQTKEAQCANELRIEEGKLSGLEEQLDQLDAKLAATRPPEASR